MSLNPDYSPREAELGAELGTARALNVRLNVKLSLAYAKIEAQEQEIRLLKGMRRDDPRRNVLSSPLHGRRWDGVW